jgi:response regulator RpfG family c-di-GMP phosphodiesterase
VPGVARKAVTVLVVEDDPELRALYRSALKAAGYQVVAVDDGVAALRHLENEVPDAVVLDLGLPLLDGGDSKEFACVLRKPLHVEALIHEIEQCVRHSGSRLL